MKQLNLWDNFSSFREIASRMGKSDWEEAKIIFLEPFCEDERADFIGYIFGYLHLYYKVEQHTIKEV